jgi:hypothetical protein
VFTSLAKSLLDASIGPMQKPAAALVWPFTIINKVILALAMICKNTMMIAELTKRSKRIVPRIIKAIQRFARLPVNVTDTYVSL